MQRGKKKFNYQPPVHINTKVDKVCLYIPAQSRKTQTVSADVEAWEQGAETEWEDVHNDS